MTDATGPAVVRDAATLIIVRRDGPEPRVLMGQRGAGAVFMPSKYVFPGGAVEAADRLDTVPAPLDPETAARLAAHAAEGVGPALARAAIRETFEETGLALGRPDPAATGRAALAPEPWRPFLARGLRPGTEALRFVFRAVTPPGRTRRFDARFFLAAADALADDPDDLARASGELRHLTWIGLGEARRLEMPFITEIVLSEIGDILASGSAGRRVPFFDHDAERSRFVAL
jgi:8-oxo-dGTP pyrophosphatase MutT (NUDIX family)